MEDNLPLVSILIPTYNRSKLVVRAINSAANQRYKNIEIIVGDNLSTDQTETVVHELMQRDSRITYFKNETNLGPVGNWIACGARASGDFIYLLFSDDYLNSECISKHVDSFIRNQDIGFSYSNLQSFHPDGSVDRIDCEGSMIGKFPSEKFLYGEINPSESATSPGVPLEFPITPSCALFRRGDFNKNLLQEIPNPLAVDFASTSHSGMGNDLAFFILTAIDYPNVYHIDEVLAYGAPDGRNLSTLHGGQENFYHYLAMQYCLNVRNLSLSESLAKAWVRRTSDFFTYLIRHFGFSGFEMLAKCNTGVPLFKMFTPTFKTLFLIYMAKSRYKLGVLRKNILDKIK